MPEEDSPEDESESEVKSEIDKYAKEVAISKPAANNNGKTFFNVLKLTLF